MPWVNKLDKGGYQARGDRWDLELKGEATLEDARVFTKKQYASQSLRVNFLRGHPVEVKLIEAQNEG